jgi:thiol-disulfide isomerase/thioredoxin
VAWGKAAKISTPNTIEISMIPLHTCSPSNQNARSHRRHCILAGLILCLSLNLAVGSETANSDYAGKISPQELLENYPEFAKEYASFEPSEVQLSEIQALAGKEIVTLFGTWCHDSAREVPRLLKLLDRGQVRFKKLTLYGVSRQKSDPLAYSETYNLLYTPTIIVKDNNGEIARIIEKPKGSLAGDLASQINSAK